MDKEETINFWCEIKNIFKKISDKFDSEWRQRKRVLGTELLVTIILKLVQNKNQQGYSSTLMQFWENCAEKNIKLPQANSVSASSLCEARQKLSEEIFQELNQELYAHLLLINLGRFIEFEAKNILPPSKKNENSIKNQGDFSSIFNPVTILNINFKNCLLAMGRHLENLILTGYDLLKDWLPKITHSIARIRQKIRPNRHYPRISHKPRDRWSNYRNLKAVKT